jgi:hypothetical protein
VRDKGGLRESLDRNTTTSFPLPAPPMYGSVYARTHARVRVHKRDEAGVQRAPVDVAPNASRFLSCRADFSLGDVDG